jgi:uncharacterized membrane protein
MAYLKTNKCALGQQTSKVIALLMHVMIAAHKNYILIMIFALNRVHWGLLKRTIMSMNVFPMREKNNIIMSLI